MMPYLRVANVFDGFIDFSDVLRMNFTEAEQVKYILKRGDILLNEGQSLELVGRSAIYDGPDDEFCFQNTLVRFRPSRRVDAQFARAVFKRWLDIGHFTSIAKQTTSIAHLGAERFAQLDFPLPPVLEQRAIATVLDTLDGAIRNTEQIIAKLQRVKQGLLRDLLTRGIDDNGELRDPKRHPEQFQDSPVGRLPKAWRVAPLGTFLDRIEAGKSPACPDIPADGDDWGVLKVSAVHPDGLRNQENKVVTSIRHINPAFEVHDGDLLMTRANTPDLVGLTCLVVAPRPQLMLCDKTLRLVISGAADKLFTFFASQMPFVRSQIEINATGSSGSMKNIGQQAIHELAFPWPPLSEQRAISDRLLPCLARQHAEKVALTKLQSVKAGLAEDLLSGRMRVTSIAEVTQ